MLEMGSIAVQTEGLAHPNDEPRHHPHEPRALMTANETKEDGECLYQNQVGDVEEISLGKCMLQAKAILEIEVGFGDAKVGHDLNVEET